MNKNAHNRKETLANFSIVTLLTFSFNLLSGTMSHYSLASLRFFGFLLLLTAFLALFPFSALTKFNPRKKENTERVLGISFIVLALLILFSSSQRVYWMLSFCIFLFGLNTISTRKISLTGETLLYILLFMFTLYNPYLYRGVTFFSFSFTRLIGEAIRSPMALGSSPSGFFIVLYFVALAAAVRAANPVKAQVQKFLLFLGGSVVLWVVALAFYDLFLSRMKVDVLLQVTLLQVLLFFMLVTLFFTTSPAISAEKEKEGQGGREKAQPKMTFRLRKYVPLALLFFSAVFLMSTPAFSHATRGKVVFYGRDCSMGSHLPQFPKEGEPLAADMGISLGATLSYFEARGYTIQRLDDTTTTSLEEALTDASVFIIANLNNPLPPEDCERIRAFVEHGGGLLVLGEHTNMMANPVDFQEGHHPLNDVLAFSGIRVNTDTAEWTREHWQTSVEFTPHPVVRGLPHGEIRTGSVGASLSVSGTARPVMTGRYAFSDSANPLEPGYLGNREYDRGEKMGDIVLAASDTYGKGRVLVFGDTSFAFNEAIPGTWRLMGNAVTFLTDTGYQTLMEWAAFLLFVVCAALTLFLKSTKMGVALVLVAALLVSGLLTGVEKPALQGDIAWIDVTHCNLVNTDGYQDSSIDGLTTNALRNGYLPLYLYDSSLLSQGEVLFIIAPTRSYSSGEAQDVAAFVEKGGILFLSVGAREKHGVEPLLRAFQMDIYDIPLGSVPWIIETHGMIPQVSPEDLEKYWHEPKFMEAYPVSCGSQYKSYASLSYLGETYELIIMRQYGKGFVVLIGDSRFLLDENLEYSLSSIQAQKPSYAALWAGNIELLKDIFTDVKEGVQ